MGSGSSQCIIWPLYNVGDSFFIDPQKYSGNFSPIVLSLFFEVVSMETIKGWNYLKTDITLNGKFKADGSGVSGGVKIGQITIMYQLKGGDFFYEQLTTYVSGVSISRIEAVGFNVWNLKIKLIGNIPDIPVNSYVINDEYSLEKTGACGLINKAVIQFTRPETIEFNKQSNGSSIVDESILNPSVNLKKSQFNNITEEISIKKKFTNNKLSNIASCKGCINNNNDCQYCPVIDDCFNLSNCSNIRVPAILINARSKIDGSDIGDAFFQICDNELHYDNKNCDNNENLCKMTYIDVNNLKTTKFSKNNLKIVKYLRGEGNTACHKLNNILREELLTIKFNEFANNIMLYALVVYILSYIIYGEFNMKYTLNKYYNQFIKDLGNSKFCAFVELFLNCESSIYGYNQYFL